ncbi:MAG: PEP-CTERM sorting domain-containing protein [Phycisphaerales bacterium]|nr:MAG: PEP-CTERM sorting domain-containing protein [Phycisphaerales bacterium]
MSRTIQRVATVLATAAIGLASASADTVVYSNIFDSTISPQIDPGVATLTGVQGFAGLGPSGGQFSGQFLRSPTGNPVTLSLTGIPPHNSISLQFLFAAIDSLDGTGTFPSGDFFRITIDGVQIFRESFANATSSQIQSYVPPPGVELARRVDLGFSGPGSFYTDSAYDMTLDPTFTHIPHSGTTATIEFLMEGPGIQPLEDESWAIDNLTILVASGCTADVDDGSGTGTPDGGVTIDDLLYYISIFATGAIEADIDDGTGTGTRDAGVTIDDLLYFITRFQAGC